ncbi:hypothetical protein [Dongia rigui]|uniref:Uncharacterized protein n=1 Tax=Dongia rigui TaxID=940149 RepID=A0ABU5DYU4_9PROT|nr:hypothetical protein [Dongia rigui]MDY0872445.1 hypothetical protein [Dongia rigui]
MAANDNACPHDLDAATGDGGAERALDSMPFAAQFAIWAARAWVTALKLDQSFATVSGDTFRRFELSAAENALDELFTLVATSAARQIDIRCMKCRLVSADETLFQEAVAAAQADNAFGAYTALRQWLPPAAARIGFRALYRFAHLLGEKQLRMPAVAAAHEATAAPYQMPSVALH